MTSTNIRRRRSWDNYVGCNIWTDMYEGLIEAVKSLHPARHRRDWPSHPPPSHDPPLGSAAGGRRVFEGNTKKSTSFLLNQYTPYPIHSDSIRQIRATTRPIWPIRPIRPTWPMRPIWPIRLIRPMWLVRPIRPDQFDPTYSTNHISINIHSQTCSPTHLT